MVEPSLQRPQLEFIENFLQPHQLQRLLVYFSRQAQVDNSYTLVDIIVRLINDPLCIIFGHHGIYLFSNYTIVLPYSELDEQQVSYISTFLRSHVHSLPPSQYSGAVVPSMLIDARVSKQMGGAYSVRPVQLSNIHLGTIPVLSAVVRGIMGGKSKHTTQFRTHSINLTLQRVVCRITVSRSELHVVNQQIAECVKEAETATECASMSGSVEVGCCV
jgi:hypothetical protein